MVSVCLPHHPNTARSRATGYGLVLAIFSVLLSACTSGSPTGAAASPTRASAQAIVVGVQITDVEDEFGNLNTDLSAAEAAANGFAPGAALRVLAEGRSVSAQFATTYSDVPRGDWLAFINDAGNVQLARNLENAAATLGVGAGDTIGLMLIESE